MNSAGSGSATNRTSSHAGEDSKMTNQPPDPPIDSQLVRALLGGDFAVTAAHFIVSCRYGLLRLFGWWGVQTIFASLRMHLVIR